MKMISFKVKVLSRVGKATGKFKLWYSVENLDTKENLSVDFDKVNEWRHISNETEEINIAVVPLSGHNTENVIVAKMKDLENWKSFKVYSVVPGEVQPLITTTWVTEKLIDDAKTIKTRLLAPGFQVEQDLEFPTAHKSTLRIAVTIAAMKSWKIKRTDIKSAFLQSQNIEQDLSLVPSKEIGDENKF